MIRKRGYVPGVYWLIAGQISLAVTFVLIPEIPHNIKELTLKIEQIFLGIVITAS